MSPNCLYGVTPANKTRVHKLKAKKTAKFIAMAPKILYTRVLTELNISEKRPVLYLQNIQVKEAIL